ncbi:MAG TPA: hypothetical protein DIT93_02460 [Pelagibacterium sp.]|nr:hypothetical protein [Pelagibacterium sp.]HCO53865.1 hypothetical protein [Pelagibacterium sp.]
MVIGASHCSETLGLPAWKNVAILAADIRSNADTMGRYHLVNQTYELSLADRPWASAVTRWVARALKAETIKKHRVAAGIRSAVCIDTVRFPGSAAGAYDGVRRLCGWGVRRCVMPIVRSTAFALAATCSALLSLGTVLPAQAQSALDAAQELAQMLDGVTATELSGDNLVSALEGAADAGQPIALWQLGTMYETGSGVQKDPAKAFQYFSRIANENADAPPSSLDADIVAQSFVKIGDYYLHGVPDAGIPEDASRGQTLLMHAATYFGDADAQFRVGMLYLSSEGFGVNPLQGARWLSLAARKGHPGAQARLGEMLVLGDGIEAQPVEGLMWLNIAYRSALGTSDEGWIRELTDSAMAKADPTQAETALRAADTLGSQFAEF